MTSLTSATRTWERIPTVLYRVRSVSDNEGIVSLYRDRKRLSTFSVLDSNTHTALRKQIGSSDQDRITPQTRIKNRNRDIVRIDTINLCLTKR